MCEHVLEALSDPRTLAEALGLKPARERAKYNCPACSSTDALSLTAPDNRVRVKCFSCDLGGDALTLVAVANGYPSKPQGRDFVEVLKAAAEVAGRQDLVDDLMRPQDRPREPRPPVIRTAPRTAPAPIYPPAAELAELWYDAKPLHEDAEAIRYLEGRGLDAVAIWRRGVARVLHAGSPVYSWASFGRRGWYDAGFRIVVPCFNAAGALTSLRAWHPAPTAGMPKRVAATGCAVRGLVMADFLGQAMLDGTYNPTLVVVAEGEPALCTWASLGRLLDADRWATLALWAGSWTQEIADRIPTGCTVVIATHHDAAGEKYAEHVAARLGQRVEVTRSAPVMQVAS